jgi:hypothetical protein
MRAIFQTHDKPFVYIDISRNSDDIDMYVIMMRLINFNKFLLLKHTIQIFSQLDQEWI